MRRLVFALISLAIATGAAGCGSGAGQSGDAASLAPAGARALVEIDGDFDSDQWQAARELAARFPDGEKALEQVREVDEAAGDRIVGVAVDDEEFVALTQPDDQAKLDSFLAEHDLVSREIEGWTAVAEDAAVLDRYRAALERGTLEGDERYEAAGEALSDDALATVYARGDGEFEWAAFALTAEEEGLRLAGRVRGGSGEAEPVASDLLAEVPGDVLAVLAFGGGLVPSELPNPLGVDLRPIAELLAGGGVVWARPGLPVPEVTALLPEGEADQLDALVRTFLGQEPEAAELDGRPAKRVRVGSVTITYGEVDGRLVITTAAAPGASGRLTDDRDFQDAREVSGMPDETNGFLYVNLRRIVPLLGFLGADDELSRNLEPIASVLAFATGEGRDHELVVFVEIR